MKGDQRVRISVVLCTHDRIEQLRRNLASLGPQISRPEVELIIVDSASDGKNAPLVRDEALRLGALHLRLDDPGLSLARNEATKVASGEWIAFLDDDAIPTANWMEILQRTLDHIPCDVAVIGGRVDPLWPGELPSPSLGPIWRNHLSLLQLDGSFDCTSDPKCVGTNLIVKRAHAIEAGLFSLHLGRTGLNLVSGEEAHLIERLIQLRYRIYYSDAFPVLHAIPVERLGIAWAKSRLYWQGYSEFIIQTLLKSRIGTRTFRAMKIAISIPVLWVMRLFSPSNHDLTLRIAYNQGALGAFRNRREIARFSGCGK